VVKSLISPKKQQHLIAHVDDSCIVTEGKRGGRKRKRERGNTREREKGREGAGKRRSREEGENYEPL